HVGVGITGERLLCRINRRREVERHQFGAAGRRYFRKAARTAAGVENAPARKALGRPAGLVIKAALRCRAASDAVDLCAAKAIPLNAEVIGVVAALCEARDTADDGVRSTGCG